MPPHSSASPDDATHAPAASPPTKVQLTPADWIAAATDVLRDKSIDAVRVDVLAKVLKVTRGSFYWHFKDRNDLLERVLQRWRDAATEQIIERFEKTPPLQRIGEFLTLPFRGQTAQNSASIELAIRAWARRDALARQAVETIDSYRLAYVAQCFGDLGFSTEEAKMRAFVVYGYMVSEALLRQQGSESERLARRAFVERIVLAPSITPS
ncbi:MAG: TetR/AcrR family transcriptional regulator [Giesbergeria sp.]|uniref:TetR/AcrR family transcriptional regulator n=1 Tax=Giesbergeria sp. TaxID=2818473 RepID=UPI0026333C91|nr:TetR/AcrR family transcriptional regulator [Giesbergeria sp.]MDD2610390.1 TetR/AcrR family transcriptional regulator [Giesbergeria sp.]